MRRAFIIFLLCAATVISTSCGTSNSTSSKVVPVPSCVAASQPTFAYVLNYNDATVSMYTVNSCMGGFTPTTPATISTGINTGINAESMVVDPNGKFLYVANLVSNATDEATVSMFSIDQTTGLLSPTSPAMVPTGFYPQGIAIDPAGKFVYTANSDDNTVSTFTVDPNSGVLTASSQPSTLVPPLFSSRSSVSSPDFVNVDPSGKFLYVTDQDNGSISSFAIDPNTAGLTATNPAGVIAGVNPWVIVFDPAERFAYVPDRGSNQVWMFTVNVATGVLTQNPAFAVPAGNQPAYMAVDPSSKFAYVVNRIDGTVSMYTINSASGTLIPNTPATVSAGSGAYPIAVNAAGTFAYVGNQGDNTVTVFKIKSNGVLAPAGSVQTGNDPVAIALTR